MSEDSLYTRDRWEWKRVTLLRTQDEYVFGVLTVDFLFS